MHAANESAPSIVPGSNPSWALPLLLLLLLLLLLAVA
jgi:hypothetical protein